MSTTLKTLQFYTADYKKHPWLFIGSLMMGPAFALQNIISPLFIAKILGQLANHHAVSIHYIWYAATTLVGGQIASYIADRYCSMPLTSLVTKNLYSMCMKRLMQQEYSFFANSFGGSLVTQANRFAKGYEMFSNTIYLEMLGIWCGVLVALGIMTYYNPLLGTLVGLLWVLSICIVIYLVRRRVPIRRRAVAKESQLTGELADAITNAITVKTFAHERDEEKRYETTNESLRQHYFRSWGVAISNHTVLQLLCILLQLVVLIGGIHAVEHGTMSVAIFLLFQVYILRIIDSIAKASMEMRQFEGVFGDAAEMTELLERTPLILDPKKPKRSRIKAGAIDLSDVQFAYNEQESDTPLLLKDFSLSIAPGEKVGLVGPSGGGKTTLTKLLLRFMDVQEGVIRIDGQDIRSITQDDLHQAISYVPQEPLLFHRSILENIRYGRSNASKAAVIAAAQQSHAHDFIKDLPNGYNTLVGERGIKLSGGQRQRIAIARAMLKHAPILVLDEATSALDSESEAYIQDSLWKLMKGKTTLVIAHRLSTIQRMDRIVVLDNGQIIEKGSHQELLKHKGLYARLWKHQSGGFIEV